MAKVPTYCPSCKDTTLQYWELISPGSHNFICDTCFTVWQVKIVMINETPNRKGEIVTEIIEGINNDQTTNHTP